MKGGPSPTPAEPTSVRSALTNGVWKWTRLYPGCHKMPRSWEALAETRVGPWPSHPGFPYHLADTWRAQRCPHHCLPSSSSSSSQPPARRGKASFLRFRGARRLREGPNSRGGRARADLHLGLSGTRDHAGACTPTHQAMLPPRRGQAEPVTSSHQLSRSPHPKAQSHSMGA